MLATVDLSDPFGRNRSSYETTDASDIDRSWHFMYQLGRHGRMRAVVVIILGNGFLSDFINKPSRYTNHNLCGKVKDLIGTM